MIGLIASIVELNFNVIMATKCPKCGSKRTQTTNLGKRALAVVCSFGVGIPVSLFSRAGGHTVSRAVYKNICPTNNYICLDCKEEFFESNF